MNQQDALQLAIERFSSFSKEVETDKIPFQLLCEALGHEGIEPTKGVLRQIEGGELKKDLSWFVMRVGQLTYQYKNCEPEVILSSVNQQSEDLVSQLRKFVDQKQRPMPDARAFQNGKSLIDEPQELKAGMDKK